MKEDFETILDESLSRLKQEKSVAVCLQRYPQYAARLEPLLRAALKVEDLREIDSSKREFVLTRHIIAAKGEFPDREALKKKFSHLDFDRYEGEQIAMRGDSWKFIWFANGNRLLFDLTSPRGERENLAEKSPETVRGYEEKLESVSGLIKYDESGEIFEFEEATKDHLRALGYLD